MHTCTDEKHPSGIITAAQGTNARSLHKVAEQEQAVERHHMLSHACMRRASHTSHDHTVREWESLCAVCCKHIGVEDERVCV